MLRRGRSNDRVDLAASAASIFAFLAGRRTFFRFFSPSDLVQKSYDALAALLAF